VRIEVTLQVDVDLEGWTTEYGHDSVGEALVYVLKDLREKAYYLAAPKWDGLATVDSVTAVVRI
jgi:hypothetical protein